MIYEPAEDSYLLRGQIPNFVSDKMRVLDVGCGSGILSLEVKECGGDVYAVDINPQAVSFCKSLGIRARVSDLFNNVPNKYKFDLIIFNPPYLPRDEDEDDESALITTGGEDGSEVLERFLTEAKDYLTKGGKLLFLSSSLTPSVEEILNREGYDFRVVDKKDLFFEKLFVYSAWVK